MISHKHSLSLEEAKITYATSIYKKTEREELRNYRQAVCNNKPR